MGLRKSRTRSAAVVVAVAAVGVACLTPALRGSSAAFVDTGNTTMSTKASSWVEGASAFATSDTAVHVEWQVGLPPASYTLQHDDNTGFTHPVSLTPTTTSADVTGLTAGTIRSFRVSAPADPSPYWSNTATASLAAPSGAKTMTLVPEATASEPTGIVAAGDGTLRFADYTTAAIYKATPGVAGATKYAPGFPSNSLKQIAIDPDGKTVFASVAGSTDTTKDGIYRVDDTGTITQVFAFGGGYGIVAQTSPSVQYWITASKYLYQCPGKTFTGCVRVWTAPNKLRYLALIPGGQNLLVSDGASLFLYKVTDNSVRKVAGVADSDIRGVYALSDTKFLIASWNRGIIWELTIAADGSTSSRRTLANLAAPRGMVTIGTKLFIAEAGTTSPVVPASISQATM